MATLQKQQISVLTMNTLAFTVNFAVWTMFSVIGIRIKAELGLNETEFGLLVATPILTGSLTRLPLGVLTDRYGGRIVFFIQMILVAIPTYGLAFATAYWQYLVIGLFVGLAGGSFAIGIAYTSAWFSKERQGTAMGIFGAGNAGAAVTNLVAPLILVAFGWRAVPQVYSIAMLVMAVIFWLFTYTDPRLEERKRSNVKFSLGEQLAPLLEARVWRFGLAYYFVFGGFVALALWLPKYYIGEYGLDLKTAAFITMLFTLPSGIIRALGGYLSDKWGGDTVTWWVFWVCIICLFIVSYPPTTMTIHGIEGDFSINIAVGVVMFTALIFIIGIAQGIGKASVYRSLADYYPNNMGSVGGLVGVIGGLGGFTMPIMFGIAADVTNVRSSTFMLMYVVLAGVMIWTWVAARNERETAGIGNGSVFQMVPSVFAGLHRRGAADQDEAAQARAIGEAEKETAVALGFTASLAAFGGFYIPLAIALSFNLTGTPATAVASFGVFYLSCVLATWWWYFRRDAEAPC